MTFSRGMVYVLAFAVLCLMVVQPMSAQSGADLFKQKCAMCHGPDGKGQTTMGKNFGLRPLSSPEVQKQSDAQLKDIVLKGKGKMPAQKVTDAQAGDLVKFVRSLK
jgi:mono/diheme cytochrome c family protein